MSFDFKINSFKGINVGKIYNGVNNNSNNTFQNINTEYEEIDYNSVITEGVGVTDEVSICLDKFKTLFDDEISDKMVVEHCYNSFKNEIFNGNKDVEKLLKALIRVKFDNPDLKLILSTDGSYYSTSKELAISSDILDINNTSTVFHEMGHLFHHLIKNDEINTDVLEMIKNARNNKETNGNMTELYNKLGQMQNEIYDNTVKEFYDNVKKETGMNQEEYFNSIVNKYETIRNNKIFEELNDYLYGESGNEAILQQLDIDLEIATILSDTDINAEVLATQYIWGEINAQVEANERGSGLAAIHDIIDAVYQGEYFETTQVTTDGTILNVYGHGVDYYSDLDYIYYELVANYTDLKTSSNEEAILDLKKVFGESFLNEVDEIYNSFIEYGDYTQI